MQEQLTNQSVELGDLLSNTIGSVVQAQEKLDSYSLARKQSYDDAEQGELALPPLWYVFKKVALEIEMSASVQQVQTSPITSAPHLVCQTLNPTMVSLYGHAASAGMRVSVQVEPSGIMPIKSEPTE